MTPKAKKRTGCAIGCLALVGLHCWPVPFFPLVWLMVTTPHDVHHVEEHLRSFGNAAEIQDWARKLLAEHPTDNPSFSPELLKHLPPSLAALGMPPRCHRRSVWMHHGIEGTPNDTESYVAVSWNFLFAYLELVIAFNPDGSPSSNREGGRVWLPGMYFETGGK